MIPWIESHIIHIGPIPIQTWGLFVAIAFLSATAIAARRATSRGLNPRHIWDVAFWIFVGAFLGARAFHVLLYDPGYYLAHPLEAIDPRTPGFAIMGGFLGGAAAAYLFLKQKSLDFLSYADALVWGVPWGCGIGRIGCFLIHDHPGTMSSFALAVRYPDGTARHDLGLYLSLVGFVIGITFLVVDRFHGAGMKLGRWLGLFLVLDGVIRFFLDFLRVVDRRIWILTPTQWILLCTTALGAYLLARRSKH